MNRLVARVRNSVRVVRIHHHLRLLLDRRLELRRLVHDREAVFSDRHPRTARVYPVVSDDVRRLALARAVVGTVAGIAAIALLVVVTTNALLAGLQFPFFPIYLVTLLTTILGFILVGVGSIWTRIPSRNVGLLVLGPPTVNITMIVTAPINPPQWSTFLFSAMWCGAVLAIGVALRRSTT